MQSTFEFCFATEVADYYDITVLVNGAPIASSPCYACARIVPLGVNSVEVQDLPSVVVAGSDIHFGVVLYDVYKNVISPSVEVSVEFLPNSNRYITDDDSNPDSSRYNFLLNVNHTETITVSLYLNGHRCEGHDYTIEVIASTPSSNSILSFVSNELQLVKNQEFAFDVKLQSSQMISVPANQYAIAIRLTNSETLYPFYNFGYSCYIVSQENNGYVEMVYRCFMKIHEVIQCVLRVYIGPLDTISSKTGSNVVFYHDELERAVVLQDLAMSLLRFTREIAVGSAFLSCTHMKVTWPSVIHVGISNILKVQLYDQYGNPYHMNDSSNGVSGGVSGGASGGFSGGTSGGTSGGVSGGASGEPNPGPTTTTTTTYTNGFNYYSSINNSTESLTVSVNNREISGFFSIDENYTNYFTILQPGEVVDGTMDIHIRCKDSLSTEAFEQSQIITVDRYHSIK